MPRFQLFRVKRARRWRQDMWARRDVERHIAAALRVQAFARMCRPRSQFKVATRLSRAARVIQRAARRWAAKRRAKAYIADMLRQRGATELQRIVRGHFARVRVAALAAERKAAREAAATLNMQRVVRGGVARRQLAAAHAAIDREVNVQQRKRLPWEFSEHIAAMVMQLNGLDAHGNGGNGVSIPHPSMHKSVNALMKHGELTWGRVSVRYVVFVTWLWPLVWIVTATVVAVGDCVGYLRGAVGGRDSGTDG